MIESRYRGIKNYYFFIWKNLSKLTRLAAKVCFFCCIASCNQSLQATFVPADKILIEELSVVNLSEDRLPVSTHDDEILLIVQTVEVKNRIPSILQDTSFEQLLFDTIHTSYDLNLDLKSPKASDSVYLIISLIELDEEKGVEQIKTIIRQEVMAGSFQKRGQETRIDKLLKYDDFLAWKVLAFDAIGKGESRQLIFEGLQLFDRFEYQLKIRGQ